MRNRTGFAMHQLPGANNISAKSRANGLMNKTYPKNRDLTSKVLNELDGDTGLLRRARSGRDNNLLGLQALQLTHRNLIVAAHLNLFTHLPEILHQVAGEGVVIIEHKNHRIRPNTFLLALPGSPGPLRERAHDRASTHT